MIGDKVILKVGNLSNVNICSYNNIRHKTIKVSIISIRDDMFTFTYNNNKYCLFNREYRILKDNKINKLLYKLNL